VRVPRQDVLAALARGRQSFALGLTGCVRSTYPTSPCDVLAHVPVLRPNLDVPNEIAIISREIHCLDVSSRNEQTALTNQVCARACGPSTGSISVRSLSNGYPPGTHGFDAIIVGFYRGKGPHPCRSGSRRRDECRLGLPVLGGLKAVGCFIEIRLHLRKM
jgi:hypothetical protein